VSRRLVNVTLDNLEDLPPRCRGCVFWELDPVSKQRAEKSGDPELEKEAWISATLLEWGSCGKLVYVDGVPAGCVLPADYMLAVGFKTVRPHHRYPRLRLELKSAVSWREDVEVALERLIGSMSPEGALRPV
jgi:hypothetical protein